MCFPAMVSLCFAVERWKDVMLTFHSRHGRAPKDQLILFMLADECVKNPFSGTGAN